MLEILSNVLGVFWNYKISSYKVDGRGYKKWKIITIIRKNRNKKLDFRKILNFFLKNEMFLKIFGLI